MDMSHVISMTRSHLKLVEASLGHVTCYLNDEITS